MFLKTGNPEYLVGVFMALFGDSGAHLAGNRALGGPWARREMRLGISLVLVGAWLPVVYLDLVTLLVMAVAIGFGFNVLSVAAQHTVGIWWPTRRHRSGWFSLRLVCAGAFGIQHARSVHRRYPD